MTGNETVQSYSVPNYSGLLYNKANTKTPFLNMISGKVKYTNSVEFVCGQYYSSEEGEIPSISETASLTAPAASFVTRKQLTNVTQIFMESVAISYAKQSNMATLSGINVAGQTANPQNELDFQVARKMEKIKRSIEKAFIQGTYSKATNDTTVNKTRGMVQAISTNVIAAEGKTLDLWLLNDLIQKISDNQGEINNLVILLNSVNLLQLTGNAVEMGVPVGAAYYSTYGIQVTDLILPVGTTVKLALGEFIPEGVALAVNLDVIGPVEQPVPEKGNFFLEELSKTGAGTKYQIFGQIGLDHGPEWYHGKLTGLSTVFTKPEGLKVNVVNQSTETPSVDETEE
ncbi:MAG: DUF5309 family protein [Bacilli bacterium]|nr:DUF5309 family protein [Bacilli bacterium]